MLGRKVFLTRIVMRSGRGRALLLAALAVAALVGSAGPAVAQASCPIRHRGTRQVPDRPGGAALRLRLQRNGGGDRRRDGCRVHDQQKLRQRGPRFRQLPNCRRHGHRRTGLRGDLGQPVPDRGHGQRDSSGSDPGGHSIRARRDLLFADHILEATVGDGEGTGTIVNDDPAACLSASPRPRPAPFASVKSSRPCRPSGPPWNRSLRPARRRRRPLPSRLPRLHPPPRPRPLPRSLPAAARPDGVGRLLGGDKKGPPGVGLEVSADGFSSCAEVIFRLDNLQIGSAIPDSGGAGHPLRPLGAGASRTGGPRGFRPLRGPGFSVARSRFEVIDTPVHRSALVTSVPQPNDVSTDPGGHRAEHSGSPDRHSSGSVSCRAVQLDARISRRPDPEIPPPRPPP